METHGFSPDKLERNLDGLLSGFTESGALPCVQAMVTRRGETAYSKAFGYADLEKKTPLSDDAIFRIYSMTKVFTSVAMLMLYEEGRFSLYDPVSRFIPEYKKTQVAELDPSGQVKLVPPKREVNIHDLFTMASGIPYPGENTLAERALTNTFRRCEADKKRGKIWDTVKTAREIAKSPLAFHPGEHWWYGMSIDILGALVEVISGVKFGEFLKQRIFDPLGLTDTGFFVPEDKVHRFVTMYDIDDRGNFTVSRVGDQYLSPPAMEGGGGGLVSTAKDVTRFARMLANLGELDGVRILSRKTVDLMRANHLTDTQLIDYNWDTQRGYGYGLGVRAMRRPEVAGYGSMGDFGWDGMAGTWFTIDPAEDLVAVFLVQIVPGSHMRFIPYFAQTVYGAIGD